MVWPTQVLESADNYESDLTVGSSRHGQDQLVIMNRWHGFQASIRLSKQALCRQQFFMRQMLTHITIFIW